MGYDIKVLINSLKGISGSGNVLAKSLENAANFLRTLEPGDLAGGDTYFSAAPIAYDLWYLWCHKNMLEQYFPGIDGNHYDYSKYLSENMSFLDKMTGLKPVKTIRDPEKHLSSKEYFSVYNMRDMVDWYNNGVYWINSIAFELWKEGQNIQHDSDGPKDFTKSEYCGYLAFPIGQLGVMEVIALIHETDLIGYKWGGKSVKGELDGYTETDKPTIQTPPLMFPDMVNSSGHQLAGMNYCYGKHILESAYLVPESEKMNVENLAEDFPNGAYEDVKPKKWMRYWMKQENTFPVPGEFVGILVRPVACPPHVWWFQESSPFLYAGNWVETYCLTSGIVIEVKLEEDRTDEKTGNQYKIKVQGCEIIVEATDFLLYSVGDRVSVLKLGKIEIEQEKSYLWNDLETFVEADKGTEQPYYVIFPGTFYDGG